jgi:hypothetical protein
MYTKHLFSALALAAFGALAAGSADSSTDAPSSTTASSPSASASPVDSSPAQTQAEYVQQIDRELTSLTNFDGSTYRESKDAIMLEAALFGAWAKILQQAENYTLSQSERTRVNRFKDRVSEIQAREFPRMRAAWGRILATAVWEHDVLVTTGGEANRTLRLTSVMFASNSNIAEIQRTVHDPLELLRFKRVEYRWYRGADEYTYYRVETPTDRAVRLITNTGWSSE